MARNPSLKTLRSRPLVNTRVNGASPSNIKGFFQYLKSLAVQEIPPANRYNMDELGILEGLGLNGLVIGDSNLRVLYRKSPDSRIWTTIIECISAAGIALPPLVIFKGKHV